MAVVAVGIESVIPCCNMLYLARSCYALQCLAILCYSMLCLAILHNCTTGILHNCTKDLFYLLPIFCKAGMVIAINTLNIVQLLKCRIIRKRCRILQHDLNPYVTMVYMILLQNRPKRCRIIRPEHCNAERSIFAKRSVPVCKAL